jgi:glutamate---cysteine ligase / carboxylate-amine ligase
MSGNVQPETHGSVVELSTGIHADVDGAMNELRELRSWLARELDRRGLGVAAAGTHPDADWEQTQVSGAPRYAVLEQTMRSLVRREPTMALHVHVGVPDPDDAVWLLNELRTFLPILLALSANSPCSQGRDGGFASIRRILFQAFPRTGTPRGFAGYSDYVETIDTLIASQAIPDPSFLWWDVRLQPRFGTVEVRVMDAQSSVSDIAPIVALIQSFARLVLEGEYRPVPASPEVVEENGFLAARDGMDALLIDPRSRRLIPLRELLRRHLETCRPHAAALGCTAELEGVARLASRTGADRQRAHLRGGEDYVGLVRHLAGEFVPRGAQQRTFR